MEIKKKGGGRQRGTGELYRKYFKHYLKQTARLKYIYYSHYRLFSIFLWPTATVTELSGRRLYSTITHSFFSVVDLVSQILEPLRFTSFFLYFVMGWWTQLLWGRQTLKQTLRVNTFDNGTYGDTARDVFCPRSTWFTTGLFNKCQGRKDKSAPQCFLPSFSLQILCEIHS